MYIQVVWVDRDWTDWALARERWWALANMVKCLWVP